MRTKAPAEVDYVRPSHYKKFYPLRENLALAELLSIGNSEFYALILIYNICTFRHSICTAFVSLYSLQYLLNLF